MCVHLHLHVNKCSSVNHLFITHEARLDWKAGQLAGEQSVCILLLRVSKQQLLPDFSLGFVIELRKEGHEEQGSTASPC